MSEEEDTKETASAEVAELREKIKEAEKRKVETMHQIERLTTQTKLFEDYSNGLFTAGGETTTNDLLDQKTIGKLFLLYTVCLYFTGGCLYTVWCQCGLSPVF